MERLLVFIFAVSLLGSCSKKGCRDVKSINYSQEAGKDDGSCISIIGNWEGGKDEMYSNKVMSFYDDGSLTTSRYSPVSFSYNSSSISISNPQSTLQGGPYSYNISENGDTLTFPNPTGATPDWFFKHYLFPLGTWTNPESDDKWIRQ